MILEKQKVRVEYINEDVQNTLVTFQRPPALRTVLQYEKE